MQRRVLSIARPGRPGDNLSNSLMGELIPAHAIRRGIAGFVLNGAIRDIDAFQRTDLPARAAG